MITTLLAGLAIVGSVLAQDWAPPSAAIKIGDDVGDLRVYGLDPDGYVKEWQYGSSGWHGPTSIGAQAKPGTTLAVVNSGASIRVYYYAPDNRYREYVYEVSSGWVPGALLP